MLDLTGKVVGAAINLEGKFILSLEINEEDSIKASYDKYKEMQKVDIKIQKHREQKSKEANAYFHLLANEIAKATNMSFAQAKNTLICRYGQPELLEDGSQFVYSSPAPVDFMMSFEGMHTTPIGYDGEQTLYAVYRGVHSYSKEEMSQLIDGTVSEALQLGIDVYPTSKVESIKRNWTPSKSV